MFTSQVRDAHHFGTKPRETLLYCQANKSKRGEKKKRRSRIRIIGKPATAVNSRPSVPSVHRLSRVPDTAGPKGIIRIGKALAAVARRTSIHPFPRILMHISRMPMVNLAGLGVGIPASERNACPHDRERLGKAWKLESRVTDPPYYELLPPSVLVVAAHSSCLVASSSYHCCVVGFPSRRARLGFTRSAY